MNRISLSLASVLVAATTVFASSMVAQAADKIRVLKVVPHAFQLTIVDVGVEKGIFAKHDIELEVGGAGGGAKLQQALAANAADIGIGTGPELGFIARGAPQIAIAATHGAPFNLGIVVTDDSPLFDSSKTVDDLKGMKIGIATPSSLTYFLTRRISVEKGWGPDGIITVPLGRVPAQMAGMKAGNIDGFMNSVDIGYNLQDRGTGRTLVSAGEFLPKFHTHLIFASNKFREANPDAVRRFLAAFYETVALVKADKQAMISVAAPITKLPEAVLSRAYDEQIGMLSDDGRFNQEALDVIADGLLVTKILDEKPDMSKLYTEEYLPAK